MYNHMQLCIGRARRNAPHRSCRAPQSLSKTTEELCARRVVRPHEAPALGHPYPSVSASRNFCGTNLRQAHRGPETDEKGCPRARRIRNLARGSATARPTPPIFFLMGWVSVGAQQLRRGALANAHTIHRWIDTEIFQNRPSH